MILFKVDFGSLILYGNFICRNIFVFKIDFALFKLVVSGV